MWLILDYAFRLIVVGVVLMAIGSVVGGCAATRDVVTAARDAVRSDDVRRTSGDPWRATVVREPT